jgi:hypothetical protein
MRDYIIFIEETIATHAYEPKRDIHIYTRLIPIHLWFPDSTPNSFTSQSSDESDMFKFEFAAESNGHFPGSLGKLDLTGLYKSECTENMLKFERAGYPYYCNIGSTDASKSGPSTFTVLVGPVHTDWRSDPKVAYNVVSVPPYQPYVQQVEAVEDVTERDIEKVVVDKSVGQDRIVVRASDHCDSWLSSVSRMKRVIHRIHGPPRSNGPYPFYTYSDPYVFMHHLSPSKKIINNSDFPISKWRSVTSDDGFGGFDPETGIVVVQKGGNIERIIWYS